MAGHRFLGWRVTVPKRSTPYVGVLRVRAGVDTDAGRNHTQVLRMVGVAY